MTVPLRAAVEALRRYDVPGLDGSRLAGLAESFNTVFRVDAAGATFSLRLGPVPGIHPAGATAAEGAWTRRLARHGLIVPQLVPAADGAASVRVAVAGERDVEASLWTWVPGDPLPGRATTADIMQLAALSARLHEASPPLDVPPPGVVSARSVHYFDVPDALTELPAQHRVVLIAARERAQQAIEQLWAGADIAPRLVHGDLTPRNVVCHGDELFAIDVQDFSWAHVEQDLAHSIYGFTRGEDLEAGLQRFRAGYERVRPWPGRLDPALLADLIAARRVSMVNLAVVRRRPGLDAYAARHADALRPLVT